MKKTMKIYMAAALLAVVSPAILAQAPVKVVCNELKQKGNELVIDAVITSTAAGSNLARTSP